MANNLKDKIDIMKTTDQLKATQDNLEITRKMLYTTEKENNDLNDFKDLMLKCKLNASLTQVKDYLSARYVGLSNARLKLSLLQVKFSRLFF
jgi:hypothetical protein